MIIIARIIDYMFLLFLFWLIYQLLCSTYWLIGWWLVML